MLAGDAREREGGPAERYARRYRGAAATNWSVSQRCDAISLGSQVHHERMRYRKGHPPRLRPWDYSVPGAYFITFQVANRRRCLGSIAKGRVQLSAEGAIVEQCWLGLPSRFPTVQLDAMVVMPDHVHAIVLIWGGALMNQGPTEAPRDPIGLAVSCGALIHQGPARPDGSGRLAPLMADPRVLLGKVVRAWKAEATLQIRREVDSAFRWQSRYWDRVIRDHREFQRVRAYIARNPRAYRNDIR